MGVELASLAEVLGRADVITVHLPKTAGDDRPDRRGRAGRHEARGPAGQHGLGDRGRGRPLAVVGDAGRGRPGRVRRGACSPTARCSSWTRSPWSPRHLKASTAEAQDKAGITIAEQRRRLPAGQFVPNAVNVDAGLVPDVCACSCPWSRSSASSTPPAGGSRGDLSSAAAAQDDYVGALVEDIQVLDSAASRGCSARSATSRSPS